MDTYRVQRRRHVEFLNGALEAGGAEILSSPSGVVAPFVHEIRTPEGRSLRLITYGFTANKYTQKGRPQDEHRFQVKYGSEFKRYHDLYVPHNDAEVTLLLGLHFEEGIIVAADPAMYNPTWFSRSVEFKEGHVEAIKRCGWYAWQRDRREGRRKESMPQNNYQTEVLLGFLPEYLLSHVKLESIASGMEPGLRMLWADRLSPVREVRKRHPLEVQMGLSWEEILDSIDEAFRLKVAVYGRAAEKHLERTLVDSGAFDRVRPIDADGKPDFSVRYRGVDFTIECKNVLRAQPRKGIKVDFQKTRAAKNDPCSRYYSPGDFDILAACLYPVTEEWRFEYCPTATMVKHPRCPGRLANNVYVGSGGAWAESVLVVLDGLLPRR